MPIGNRVSLIASIVAVSLGFSVCFSMGGISILKSFPINGMEGVLSKSDVSFDKNISSDGKGSLRITVSKPTTVKLFEVSKIDVDEARLIYQARVRTKQVRGQAYLEMWCRFPDGGEYFSRSLNKPLSGTIGWTTTQTPFFLRKGQKPNLIKLNVVIKGTGTLWIDDITLAKAPLQ
jgi:hypothetical protein